MNYREENGCLILECWCYKEVGNEGVNTNTNNPIKINEKELLIGSDEIVSWEEVYAPKEIISIYENGEWKNFKVTKKLKLKETSKLPYIETIEQTYYKLCPKITHEILRQIMSIVEDRLFEMNEVILTKKSLKKQKIQMDASDWTEPLVYNALSLLKILKHRKLNTVKNHYKLYSMVYTLEDAPKYNYTKLQKTMENTCFKCGGLMKHGFAFKNQDLYGLPENGRTMVYKQSGEAQLYDVQKCVSCGHSYIK